VTDKLIGYLVGAGCITVFGWTLRQWWRASRRSYVYNPRRRKH